MNKNVKQNTIKIIPWSFKLNSPCKNLNSRILEIEQSIAEQVTKALIKINNLLKINLRLAEIYYDLQEMVYRLLLIHLV